MKPPFTGYRGNEPHVFCVTRDDKQFMMATGNQEALVDVNLVLGWSEELQRLALPSK